MLTDVEKAALKSADIGSKADKWAKAAWAAHLRDGVETPPALEYRPRRVMGYGGLFASVAWIEDQNGRVQPYLRARKQDMTAHGALVYARWIIDTFKDKAGDVAGEKDAEKKVLLLEAQHVATLDEWEKDRADLLAQIERLRAGLSLDRFGCMPDGAA